MAQISNVQAFSDKCMEALTGTGRNGWQNLSCRPELSYEALEELDTGRQEAYRALLGVDTTDKITLDNEVVEQINIAIKYDGYISRQKQQVEHFQKMEKKQIPDDINYDDVANLRKEARQKLSNIRPTSLGQAVTYLWCIASRCVGVDDLSGDKETGIGI